MMFAYDGGLFELFDHPYNVTAANERAVEVPVALAFIAEHDERPMLEVGNVLSHYGVTGHDIVDLYEHAPGVSNIDVFDVEGTWPTIVSVSTVEHIGWTPGRASDPSAASAAIEHMRSLLAPGGHLLVTAGLGQHSRLDDDIRRGAFDAGTSVILARHGDHWVQRHPADHDAWQPYDWQTPTARSVWIGTWSA